MKNNAAVTLCVLLLGLSPMAWAGLGGGTANQVLNKIVVAPCEGVERDGGLVSNLSSQIEIVCPLTTATHTLQSVNGVSIGTITTSPQPIVIPLPAPPSGNSVTSAPNLTVRLLVSGSGGVVGTRPAIIIEGSDTELNASASPALFTELVVGNLANATAKIFVTYTDNATTVRTQIPIVSLKSLQCSLGLLNTPAGVNPIAAPPLVGWTSSLSSTIFNMQDVRGAACR